MSAFSDWFDEHLAEYAQDLAEHGADAGFVHITYTSDCVDLYNRFESDIWDMLREDSESMGYPNVQAMIATFNRQDMLDDPDQYKNLLVWYACESLAHQHADRLTA